MELHSTPAPGPPAVSPTPPGTVTQAVTHIVTKGVGTDDGAFAALIGGVVGSLLLLLLCIIAVLLWCLSRQKGSYVTKEMDEEEEEEEEEDGGSDAALRSLKEPLKTREDE